MSSPTRVVFDPKRAADVALLLFDFTSLLASGETISTQSVAASVWSGVDANPSAIVSGSATASGAIVKQLIAGGVAGVIYTLTCTITTSLGQTRTLVGLLAIVPGTM
jgi:hypothetical protein